MHDFETAKKQYEEAKHAMIEAQVWMEEAVRNFDGTIQEALDAGMIRLNFPKATGREAHYMRQDIRRFK